MDDLKKKEKIASCLLYISYKTVANEAKLYFIYSIVLLLIYIVISKC